MKKFLLSIAIMVLAGPLWSTSQKTDQAGSHGNPYISSNISNQKVTSFTEDEYGYIWISTIRGLNRYNNHEYHQYFSTADSTTISDNYINQVYRDSKGRLWVGTVNGISKYNDQDCFDRVPIESLSANALHLFENNDGKLFLNMNFEICVYDEDAEKFVPAIPSISNNTKLTYCFIDKSNNIWVVTSFDVKCYNSHTYELKDSFPTKRFNTFAFLNDNGELWLSSWGMLNIYDTRTGKYIEIPEEISTHPQLKDALIYQIHPYNNSSILIRTQKKGVFLYNQLKGEVLHQSENGFPFEVPDFEITTFFTDSQKNLWIGSYDKGYAVRYSYQERFNNNNYLRSKLEDQSVTSIVTDKDNNLWITSRSEGIKVFRNNDQQMTSIPNEELFSFWKGFQHQAKKIFVDSENNIWVLSDWMLLKTRYINNRPEVIKNYYFPNGIMSIAEDSRGTIWLGGMNENIYTLHKGDKEFEIFHLYGKGFNFTPAIQSLSSGKLIIVSFNQEIQLIDPFTRDVSTIEIKDKIESSFFIPVHLFEDSEGNVWIGTLTNGLYKYTPKDGNIEHIEGMTCNDISSIIEDVTGNIWVGTLYGLSKYDRTTEKFINYFEEDGIGGNQFNEQSVCRLPDNTLIFGGTHGLTFFNPIDLTYRRNIPLYFGDLKIHNILEHPGKSKCIDKQLLYNPDIRLKHDQNTFTISFAALDYCEFERVKYAYMLEGFDKIWIETNKNHEAYYSNVPSGKYTFRVKIYNDENTINETENSIFIRVKPSPRYSPPAIAFYLLVFVSITYILLLLRKRLKEDHYKALLAEQEKEQEHRINRMNMSFFANLSHEFRTPLTMIAGPISTLSNDESIMGEKKQMIHIIQRSVNRMLRLVNQLMDFNKLENDTLKLKVKPTDIITELKKPIEVFKMNAREKGIELSTYGLEDNFVMWLDTDKLEKITANLIANALKYSSPGGNISISFDVINRVEAAELFEQQLDYFGEQYVKISIADTGKGIPEDKLEKIFERYYQLDNQNKEFNNWGSGIGLYYARCLVELHHGRIKAGNRSSGGAVFSFILPVEELAYSKEEKAPGDENTQDKILPVPVEHEPQVIPQSDTKNGKANLLIIDDDTDIVHYLKTMLTPHFNISYKFDADSAYQALKEIDPDLIICDVVMPGTDGYEFSQKVKDNLSFCHIPIILVTAKATVENQVEGLNSGADAYVTKPFVPSYLLALINSQLNNRKKIQSLLGSNTRTDKLEENVLTPHDNNFISSLYDLMEKELSNPELNINRMTEVLKISRTKFYYKVKGLTGENPNVFFKTYKLNRASELLLEGKYNISEIADITGFSTLSHFSVSFKKQFGVAPSGYNKMG